MKHFRAFVRRIIISISVGLAYVVIVLLAGVDGIDLFRIFALGYSAFMLLDSLRQLTSFRDDV